MFQPASNPSVYVLPRYGDVKRQLALVIQGAHGRIQPVRLRGETSETFGSQISLEFTNVREMK